ncbi:hypothetical protein ABZ078_40555, partial [Streptomyces sp. NPDC006385]
MSPVTFGAPGTGTTAVVAGTGGCLPARVLANDDVIAAGALNTTDEWLRTRTGIARRRRATPGAGTGALAPNCAGPAFPPSRASDCRTAPTGHGRQPMCRS